MKNSIFAVVIALLSTTVCFTSFAAEEKELERSNIRVAQAEHWGLNPEQWQRYINILNQPDGFDMYDSNPLIVLGRFARTPEERKHYAEMLVKFDKNRTDGLLAFDRAYRDAWQRLYPTLKPIAQQLPERISLFVKSSCTPCIDALKAWRSRGVSVDVFMVDGAGNDQKLRQWAGNAGIRQSDVNSKRITLNHDTRGLWFNVARGHQIPTAIAKQGDTWSVISLP